MPALVLVIFATYTYFLQFAQFAFLKSAQAATGDAALQTVMAVMGAAGIVGSFASAKLLDRVQPAQLLGVGFVFAGVTAISSQCVDSVFAFAVIGGWIGCSLGMITVSVSAILAKQAESSRIGLIAGLGTGAAYAFCNIPAIFSSITVVQCLTSAGICVVGAMVTFAGLQAAVETPSSVVRPVGTAEFWLCAVALTALVWLDSAAFYTIQNSEELKRLTWHGDRLLWLNAGAHFFAAVAAGVSIDKRFHINALLGTYSLLGCAVLVLGVRSPGAGILYCMGVSLYSTVLVTLPPLTVQSKTNAAWKAAALYSIAGWFGSAMGIGMAQDLHHVPNLFLVVCGMVVGLFGVAAHAVRQRAALISFAGMFVIALLGMALDADPALAAQPDAVEAGRQVYVREGCIHCHSQYVRPGTIDAELWGPLRPLEEMISGSPPLIGNRRNGPDLLNVGNRRAADWLKLFLISPQRFRPGAVMPAYAHLFQNNGEAPNDGATLVQYLSSLGAATFGERRAQIEYWSLPGAASGEDSDAARLYERNCAVCHGADGRGDGPAATELSVPPRNLRSGPLFYSNEHDESSIARVIKFGTFPSPMPGHEYFSDAELRALARYVQALRQS